MVLVGGLMGLHVLGINIQPLLTVGGVSGIIVGLSAQSVLGNLISGINLVRQLRVSLKFNVGFSHVYHSDHSYPAFFRCIRCCGWSSSMVRQLRVSSNFSVKVCHVYHSDHSYPAIFPLHAYAAAAGPHPGMSNAG